jgi:nucleotide-binding universal stress UspA family protein
LTDLSRQLAWHGITAEVKFMSSAAEPAGEVLKATARFSSADLLVMGGYGHSRMREIAFGGFTQSVLESAEMPVFLMH